MSNYSTSSINSIQLELKCHRATSHYSLRQNKLREGWQTAIQSTQLLVYIGYMSLMFLIPWLALRVPSAAGTTLCSVYCVYCVHCVYCVYFVNCVLCCVYSAYCVDCVYFVYSVFCVYCVYCVCCVHCVYIFGTPWYFERCFKLPKTEYYNNISCS